MKYVLMFTSEPALDATGDPDLAKAVYGRIYEWFQTHEAVITDGGAELMGVDTATTVGHQGVVVDGPFNEAKEVIGGFSVIDVPDLQAAIDVTKSWPALDLPGRRVEIRPMVTDYSQFE